MKTITGKLNFLMCAYTLNDFLAYMDINNVNVISIQSKLTGHIVTVSGYDDDLNHARWFFRNCGSIL